MFRVYNQRVHVPLVSHATVIRHLRALLDTPLRRLITDTRTRNIICGYQLAPNTVCVIQQRRLRSSTYVLGSAATASVLHGEYAPVFLLLFALVFALVFVRVFSKYRQSVRCMRGGTGFHLII